MNEDEGNVTPIKGKSHRGTGLRHDLSMSESFELICLMKAEYTSSGMTDRQFAEYAMTKITLREGAVIKDHNVKSRRDTFEIPANRGASKAPDDTSAYTAMLLKHEAQLSELTERMNMLESWVNATFPTKSRKATV